jgi:hypothetical protein
MTWLKLYRDAIDHPVFQDADLWRLWTWCLMRANYAETKWKDHTLSPGQFVTGRNTASEQLGITPSKWYRGIQRLVDLGCITVDANSVWTTISVSNWTTYQSSDSEERTANEQPMNSEWTADEQPMNTVLELKKERRKESKTRAASSRFVKPTLEEVSEYCRERNNSVDPGRFIDHYESVGWVVGANKAPMKDWKAALRGVWESRSDNQPNGRLSQTRPRIPSVEEELAASRKPAGARS